MLLWLSEVRRTDVPFPYEIPPGNLSRFFRFRPDGVEKRLDLVVQVRGISKRVDDLLEENLAVIPPQPVIGDVDGVFGDAQPLGQDRREQPPFLR